MLALGSPGGATIITTVLQVLVEHLDLGRSLAAAVAAPRAGQRNGATTRAESGFPTTELERYGHRFAPIAEIGAAAALSSCSRSAPRASG